MPPNELHPHLIVCILFQKSIPLIPVAEACLRFTPQIALREIQDDEAIFLEIGKSRGLFSPEALLARVRVLCTRFNVQPKIAMGPDPAQALAFARWGINRLERLPLHALTDLASPFFINENQENKLQSMIQTLRLLGQDTIGDFLKLPSHTLTARFGPEALLLARRVRGELPPAWPGFTPPERISEEVDLEDSDSLSPCFSLETLIFTLKGTLDRTMSRLRGRALRLAAFQLEFKLDDRTLRHWKIELPMPQGGTAGLVPILRDQLGYELSQKPLSAPVVRFLFTVLETAPGRGSQRDFFNRKEDDAEAWDALVGRLCQKLGRNGAFFATPVERYLPEKAWKRTLTASQPEIKTWQASERKQPELDFGVPVRLLPEPEPLRKLGDLLVHCQVPRRWRTLAWQGPERISGEWWLDPQQHGFERDYYRVETERGASLWIFKTPRNPELFYLHGYFD